MQLLAIWSWCLCVFVWHTSAVPPAPPPAPGREVPLDIRSDGSYRFAYSTGDAGRHYHTSSASADNTVSGVFGSRDPKTGGDLKTTYTAGKRGFRANGPHIARKMDLSQNVIPYHPPVSPDSSQYNPTYSTYHDPNEDPTYSFEFHTPTHSRKEDSDYKGDVNGRYSYVDDVGQRHDVEYEAGSKIGFHVKNAYPDSSPLGAGVFYAGPPANKKGGKPLRGHTAITRGKDGSYSFTAVGPDQRRMEESDATGHVKGFYTYVDDKGVQRTTQYIAGPNIGYKIINSHTNSRYPVVPYPPPYTPFLPPETEDKGTGFGTGPGISSTGVTPGQGGSGQRPSGGGSKKPWTGSGGGGFPQKPLGGDSQIPWTGTGDGSKDPWTDVNPTGGTTSTTTPIPGTGGGGGFGDIFGPSSGGGPTGTGDDNDEDYNNGEGYDYHPPDKDAGPFLLPQPSTPSSNIPYGNCCKLAPNRPAHGIKSPSRPSRNHEEFLGFPSGLPIRAHVQSLDIKTYGSRLPTPGVAIDLPVPPKSRRGAESDEPDYWGVKLRRTYTIEQEKEDQDAYNIQSSRSVRHSGERGGDTEETQDSFNVNTGARYSAIHGVSQENHGKENQDIFNRESSSIPVNPTEFYGQKGVAQSEENQDKSSAQIYPDPTGPLNVQGKQTENSDEIFKTGPMLNSGRISESQENTRAVQIGGNQDFLNIQTSTGHLELQRQQHGDQSEEDKKIRNLQTPSETQRHLRGDKRVENQGRLQRQSSSLGRYSVERDTEAEYPEFHDILKIPTRSGSLRNPEFHDHQDNRREENKFTPNLQTSSSVRNVKFRWVPRRRESEEIQGEYSSRFVRHSRVPEGFNERGRQDTGNSESFRKLPEPEEHSEVTGTTKPELDSVNEHLRSNTQSEVQNKGVEERGEGGDKVKVSSDEGGESKVHKELAAGDKEEDQYTSKLDTSPSPILQSEEHKKVNKIEEDQHKNYSESSSYSEQGEESIKDGSENGRDSNNPLQETQRLGISH